MKAVIGGLQPVHSEGRGQSLNHALHQLPLAEIVPRSVHAQCRYADLRQVCVTQLLGLTGRMQRIGEQQQTIARKALTPSYFLRFRSNQD